MGTTARAKPNVVDFEAPPGIPVAKWSWSDVVEELLLGFMSANGIAVRFTEKCPTFAAYEKAVNSKMDPQSEPLIIGFVNPSVGSSEVTCAGSFRRSESAIRTPHSA